MDQTYIGYFDWYQPTQDIQPPVSELDLNDVASFGVAVAGRTEAWPGFYLPPSLPTFDSLRRERSWIEIFPRGKQPIAAKPSASDPWIILTEAAAFSTSISDRRYWVDIDWTKVPDGQSEGSIEVSSGDGSPAVSIAVSALKASADQTRAAKGCWGGLSGPFSIPADGFERNAPAGNVRWETIPDYGRVEAAMSIFPVNAPSIVDPAKAPRLDYPIFVGETGDWTFDLVTAPTLNVNPAHKLSLALWVDNGKPQIVTVFTPERRETEEFLGAAHDHDSRTDMRIMRFKAAIAKAGRHRLSIAMVDPTIVIESIIAYRDKLPESYFGPPSIRIGEPSLS